MLNFSHVGFFVLNKEVDEILVVLHLLFLNRHYDLDLVLEFIQMLQEIPALLHELIDVLIVLL